MEHHVLIYSLVAIIGLIVTACRNDSSDAQLLHAESLMDDSLCQARVILDNIDRESLCESDRNLLDFLRIKGEDKAYVHHTGDSTILRIVDYYEDHKSFGRYSEALYYAGRVYSDLGDYPTALEYYQKAFDELCESGCTSDLGCRIVGNMAYTINALRMYEQTIPSDRDRMQFANALQDTTDSKIVEELVESNGWEAAQIENAVYNYGRHDRNRQKAELKSSRLSIMILCLLIFLLALVIIMLFIRRRHLKQQVKLYEAIDRVRMLREKLELTKKDAELFRIQSNKYQDMADEYRGVAESLRNKLDGNEVPTAVNKDRQDLVCRLRNEIRRFSEFPDELPELPESIVKSAVYGQLQKHIEERKTVPEKSDIWKRLVQATDESYPNFKTSVVILFNGKISDQAYRLLMLIKLRIQPSHIAVLLGKERGTISKARGMMCEKIFGDKEGSKYFDRAIILI